jgi:CDGSH-type Zn-finger protein
MSFDKQHKKPHVMKMEPGLYSWCPCGMSKNLPFCDSSHKGTEWHSVKVQLDEPKTVAWCGCLKTSTPPFCDGTHNKL